MVQLALAGLIGLSSWNDRRQAGWNPPVFKRQLTLICAVMRLGLIRCFTPAVVQELVLSGQQSATLTFISDIERARQIQHLEARSNRCICPHPLSHERYPVFSQPCFFCDGYVEEVAWPKGLPRLLLFPFFSHETYGDDRFLPWRVRLEVREVALKIKVPDGSLIFVQFR